MDANKKAQGADNAKGSNANDCNIPAAPIQSTLFDLPGVMPGTEARAARDEALDNISRSIDPAWRDMANRILLATIDRLGAATVDDCRDLIPAPAVADWWCIIPRMLALRGVIRRVGSRPGVAAVTHGGDLRLWARVVSP